MVDGSGPVPGVDPGLNSLFWGEAPGLRNPGSNSTAPVAAPDCPAAAGLLALGASAKSSTSIGPVSADGDPALSPTRRSPGGESIAAAVIGRPPAGLCFRILPPRGETAV